MINIPDTTVPPPMPPAARDDINAKLAELETLLAPYSRTLTDAERRGLAKMGPDSIGFVQNGETAINYSLNFMARDFDADRFRSAAALADQLNPVALRLAALAQGVNDGDMLFGSIAYTDALDIYGELPDAARRDSKLQPFLDAMRARFAALRGKRVTPAAPRVALPQNP